MKKETRTRSIVKGITWRICATITTMLLVFIFTGNMIITFSVGIFDFISKFLLYYLHERAWNIIRWGIRND